jgi:ribosome-associated protein
VPLINPRLTIPEQEIHFTFSRSPGPGGQHVNKVNSRVTLWFDVDASPTLTADEKQRLHQRLSTRINKEGRLWLVAFASRSQHANRESALLRFAALLREAFTDERHRLATKVPNASKKRRLAAKKHRATLKHQSRAKVASED